MAMHFFALLKVWRLGASVAGLGFGWSRGRDGVGGAGVLRLGVVDTTDKWLADVAGWALFREHWNCRFA
jgi:hypothetical protein